MRFLKKKIALSAQSKAQKELNMAQSEKYIEIQEPTPNFPKEKSVAKNTLSSLQLGNEKGKKKDDLKSTKTVVKNYGKAIASFALSQIAVPYLNPLLKQEQIKLAEFVEYISRAKESIEGIDTFRALLLIKEDDDSNINAYKRVFRAISEIFIKYFSVNWIFSGRMVNKQVHLIFRFKMLRRIKHPELFTYLK